MDLTNYLELEIIPQTNVITTVTFRLDKKTMLEMLLSNSILIFGCEYKVPEQYLLELLINKQYGETKLNLEQINPHKQ